MNKNINFGELHNSIRGYVVENFTKDHEKTSKLTAEYFTIINKDEILTEEFNLFTAIENPVNIDNSEKFISENFDYFTNLNPSDINESNKKLLTLITEWNISTPSEYEAKELFESIDNIIKLPKKPSNVTKRYESFSFINEHVKKSVVELSGPTYEADSLLETFNTVYNGVLTEEEEKVLKAVLNSDESEQKELFESSKKECIKLLNEDLKNVSDLATKESYLNAKEVMLEMEYKTEGFEKDIIKLINFKKEFNN